jgi:translation initiation factor 1A
MARPIPAWQQQPERVRFPRQGEVLGVVEQLLGYAKMRVKCLDGKTRICRVPGKLMRALWINERDIVLIKPWEIQHEDRGDVIYKYRKTQVAVLKSKGFLKGLESEL